MNKKTVVTGALLVVCAGLCVWDFMRGEILWGAILGGATLFDAVKLFMKPVEEACDLR